MKNKGQISAEYMIVIGFVTFAVMVIALIAYVYAGMAKDSIVLNQAENIAEKIIFASEEVFYSGAPSITSFSIYIPEQITALEIVENKVVVTATTSVGVNKMAFSSNVPIEGTISIGYGINKISVKAEDDKVVIS